MISAGKHIRAPMRDTPDEGLLAALKREGAVALSGRHDLASLRPEDRLRALSSLARFVSANKGKAAKSIR